MTPGLPSFRDLLKSRDVEDPVNLWVHRPLAYAFVALVYRTPLTPNGVTFLAMVVGIAAGVCFLVGTPATMIAGGILLWSSAILDGADGILARAKSMQSQFGRALDGSADMIVAIFTVFPMFAHMWFQYREPLHLVLMVPAIGLTVVHLYLYDYYKESYLRMTRPGQGGEGDDASTIEKLIDEARAKGPIVHLAVKHMLIPYLRAQTWWVGILNPRALREGKSSVVVDERVATIYRRHNYGPMQLWAVISLAPHSYIMAICAMLDRADAYLWIRLVAMNVVFAVVGAWQRIATKRTEEALMSGDVVVAS